MSIDTIVVSVCDRAGRILDVRGEGLNKHKFTCTQSVSRMLENTGDGGDPVEFCRSMPLLSSPHSANCTNSQGAAVGPASGRELGYESQIP